MSFKLVRGGLGQAQGSQNLLDPHQGFPPVHQSCVRTITSCLRTIRVASGPSRVASGPSELPPDHRSCLQTITSCLRTIGVASGPSQVASGPSELPPDHVRKKNSQRLLYVRKIHTYVIFDSVVSHPNHSYWSSALTLDIITR